MAERSESSLRAFSFHSYELVIFNLVYSISWRFSSELAAWSSPPSNKLCHLSIKPEYAANHVSVMSRPVTEIGIGLLPFSPVTKKVQKFKEAHKTRWLGNPVPVPRFPACWKLLSDSCSFANSDIIWLFSSAIVAQLRSLPELSFLDIKQDQVHLIWIKLDPLQV